MNFPSLTDLGQIVSDVSSRVSSQITSLIDRQSSSVHTEKVAQPNKINWIAGLLGKPGAVTPGFNQRNGGLNLVAQNLDMSKGDVAAHTAREAARENPGAQVREWKEGIQVDGSYIANILPGDV